MKTYDQILKDPRWAYLIKKYPDRAGKAFELYLADPKKTANPTTYFNFAGKKLYESETRYQRNLAKYIQRNPDLYKSN